VSSGMTVRSWDELTGEELSREELRTPDDKDGSFVRNSAVFGYFSEIDKSAYVRDGLTGVDISIQLADRALSPSDGLFVSMTAAFSGNDELCALGTSDGYTAIWDVRTAREIATVRRHSGNITSLAFSPDGQRLATTSEDGTTRIWDTATGTAVAILEASNEPIWSAAFSADGAQVMTVSGDGARIWDISDLEEGDAFAIACARLGDNTGLVDIQERYGLSELVPICGDHPPLPVDWRTLE